MTNHCVGHFLGVIGIVLVSGSTPKAGAGFSGELELWFLCDSVLSVYALEAPHVFTLGGLYVLGYAFSFCLDVGSLSLLFLVTFGFTRGGVVGVGGVLMTGLNRGKRLGALSVSLFFTLRAGSISHRFISFFSAKIFTSCCKAKHFPSPISLVGVTCAGFSKNFPISATGFLMAYVVDMKGVLVDCEKKNDRVC